MFLALLRNEIIRLKISRDFSYARLVKNIWSKDPPAASRLVLLIRDLGLTCLSFLTRSLLIVQVLAGRLNLIQSHGCGKSHNHVRGNLDSIGMALSGYLLD